jgi:hypothetical protein
MSGESSGWACEVPTELSDNTELSKIHFFDIIIPFEQCWPRRLFNRGRVRADAPFVLLIARTCASTDRERHVATARQKQLALKSKPYVATQRNATNARPQNSAIVSRDVRQSGHRECHAKNV